jgi:predicted nucleic acid-binding protein
MYYSLLTGAKYILLLENRRTKMCYIKYNEKVVTITLLHLVEVIYSVFQNFGEEKAQQIYNPFKDSVQDIDSSIILKALQLKQKHKKRYLSYADCIGYAFAEEKGIFFLTGDKGFEDLPNVEFGKSYVDPLI